MEIKKRRNGYDIKYKHFFERHIIEFKLNLYMVSFTTHSPTSIISVSYLDTYCQSDKIRNTFGKVDTAMKWLESWFPL